MLKFLFLVSFRPKKSSTLKQLSYVSVTFSYNFSLSWLRYKAIFLALGLLAEKKDFNMFKFTLSLKPLPRPLRCVSLLG